MSIKIDGEELGDFIEFGTSALGGFRLYRGKGLEDEGKKIEKWLKDYSVGISVRVKDNKFPEMRRSVILKITEITNEWEGNIFNFTIAFDNP